MVGYRGYFCNVEKIGGLIEMSDVMKLAQDLKDTILADRRFLHTHPGVGFAIEDTLEYVKEQLEQMGYEPERCGRAGRCRSARKW